MAKEPHFNWAHILRFKGIYLWFSSEFVLLNHRWTGLHDIHVIVYWTSTFTCTCVYLLSSFSSFSASMSSERTKNVIHIHITTSYKLHDRWVAHLQLAQVHCLPFWLIIIASHNIRVEYHKYNTYIYIYTIYISAQLLANPWDEEALQVEGHMSE